MGKRVEKIPERFRDEVERRLAAVSGILRAKRKSLGLSQETLAERLDVSHMTVQFLEQRRRFPSLPFLFYVCAFLGIEISIGSAEPEIVPVDDPRVEAEKYRTLLPLHSLSAAAGAFGTGKAVELLGWVEVKGRKLSPSMFVARAVGSSMEPKIRSGDYLVFREQPERRQGKIVLAQMRSQEDPETGGSFTVKQYSSRGHGEEEQITLKSLNPRYKSIELDSGRKEELGIVAEFLFRL